ncbi:MAG: hypothetical protein AB7G11_07940 [Phycisphaerales bacterium]
MPGRPNGSSRVFAWSLGLSVVFHALLTVPAGAILLLNEYPSLARLVLGDERRHAAKHPDPQQPAADPEQDQHSVHVAPPIKEVRLGIDESASDSIVWMGFAEQTPHSAPKSEVDQSAMTTQRVGAPVEPGASSPPTPATSSVPPAPADAPPPIDDGAPEPARVQENQPSATSQQAENPAPTTPAAPAPETPDQPPHSPHSTSANAPTPPPAPEGDADEHAPRPSEGNTPDAPTPATSDDAADGTTPEDKPDTTSPIDFIPADDPAASVAERVEAIRAAASASPPPARPALTAPPGIDPGAVQAALSSSSASALRAALTAINPPAAMLGDLARALAHPAVAATPASPAAGGQPVDPGDPGIRNDKEADASSTVLTAEYRNGKVLAGEGLDIKTVRPNFSRYTRVTAAPSNPVVEIWFDRTGVVRNVELKQSSGYRDVDEPVKNAVWAWTARGKVLRELASKRPDGIVKIEITLLLRG